MNASSESGLWAVTISRGETRVIGAVPLPVYTTTLMPFLLRAASGEKGKGGHQFGLPNSERSVGNHHFCASRARPLLQQALVNPVAQSVPNFLFASRW